MSARSSTVGPPPLAKTPATPVPPIPVMDRKPVLLQSRGHPPSGAPLLVRQFGMLMQVLIESLLVGLEALVAATISSMQLIGRGRLGHPWNSRSLDGELAQVGPGQLEDLVARRRTGRCGSHTA